jgi:protein associated with RNAse G/E
MRLPQPEPEIHEPVRFRLYKWDGSPHRQAMMVYLGADVYGYWLSIPTGVIVRRQGSASVGRATHVMLVPHDGHYLAHFNAPTSENVIYADITSAPEFGDDGSGWVIAAADMDLDVVRRGDGRAWIEDEDEFMEHIDSYGYPADVAAVIRTAADELLAAVRDGSEPFGTAWLTWIDRAAVVADQ